jgi:hypothetical protein
MSFWLCAESVSSDQWQTSAPSSVIENSGSQRPPFFRGTPATTTFDTYDHVCPPSVLFHTGIDIGASAESPPDEADQSNVPAGIAPTCFGSSNSVPQQSPALLMGSSTAPISVNESPSSVLSKIVAPIRPEPGRNRTTEATMVPFERRIARG